MTCADDRYEWPPEDTLFDNAAGEYPPDTTGDTLYKDGRQWTVETVPAIDDYQP